MGICGACCVVVLGRFAVIVCCMSSYEIQYCKAPKALIAGPEWCFAAAVWNTVKLQGKIVRCGACLREPGKVRCVAMTTIT